MKYGCSTPENNSLENETRKLKTEQDEIAVQIPEASLIGAELVGWYELREKCNKN